MAMIPRKTLDIDGRTLRRALWSCASTWIHPDFEAAWGPSLATLSIRTAFDLWLRAMRWPAGSEVLMSAVTIPQMKMIVEAHGYVPVAVDFDPRVCFPGVAELEAHRSSRTKAVVVAQLFGARNDLHDIARWAKQHGLLLVEDCAQCYAGKPAPLAAGVDLALHSFGSIKTATCLGGAIAQLRDPSTLEAMKRFQAQYARQSRVAYAKKILKYAALHLATKRWLYPFLIRVLDRLCGDYDRAPRALTRGFPDAALLVSIRKRPSLPLLALMAHRFSRYDAPHLARRRANGEQLSLLFDDGVELLGGAGARHSHWLVPVRIRSRDSREVIRHLRAHGFDATSGASTLVAIDARASRAYEAMENVVYLPAGPTLTPAEVSMLAERVNELARRGTVGVESSDALDREPERSGASSSNRAA